MISIESIPTEMVILKVFILINKKLAYASDISLFYKKDHKNIKETRLFIL